MAVTKGVGPEGGEKVATGSGPGVEVGMRAITCPQPDRKRSAEMKLMVEGTAFLAITEVNPSISVLSTLTSLESCHCRGNMLTDHCERSPNSLR